MVLKKKDLYAFTGLCTTGLFKFRKALYDLKESINLKSLVMFRKIILGDPKSTTVSLLMEDHFIKMFIRVLYDVLVK